MNDQIAWLQASTKTNHLSLLTGQRLSLAEFERRYEAHPEIKNAELIEGVVYVASPVSLEYHSQPHHHLVTWTGVYCAFTPGLLALDNVSLRLSDHTEVQPDIALALESTLGGQAWISADDFLEGIPELIIEVGAYDLNQKKRLYAQQGVPEYIVVQPLKQRLDWFALTGNGVRIRPDQDGILRSKIFPGLWLDPKALWAKDMKTVLAVLHQGLASSEHAAFVEKLAAYDSK